LTSKKPFKEVIDMTQEKDLRPKGPQKRIADLDVLKFFWDTMSRHFGDMPVDLSLFNYKAKTEKGLLVRQGADGNVNIPIAQAYDAVLKLIDKYYHRGEDILWRPAYSMSEDFPVSMIWLDDFNLDNELGLKPLVYIQTSPKKFQAFFKLKEPVPRKVAEDLQKALARLTGDKGATGYVQHRRMAGLVNGKYEDEPLILMFLGEEGDGIIDPAELKPIAMFEASPIEGARAGVATDTVPNDVTENSFGSDDVAGNGQEDTVPNDVTENSFGSDDVAGNGQEPEGQSEGQEPKRQWPDYIKPVGGMPYRTVGIKSREDFVKKRKDGTIDESATDMAWAVHMVRRCTLAGWDEGTIALSVYDKLRQKSPEIKRRKGNLDHARDYLYRTVLRAIDLVRKTPLQPRQEPETELEL
jgi:hypothetical protein